MSLVKEDWERVHLMDEMYIKEMEYLEMEHYKNGDSKPPAKITVKDGRRKSRSGHRTDKEKAKIARRAKRKLKVRKV